MSTASHDVLTDVTTGRYDTSEPTDRQTDRQTNLKAGFTEL